MRDITRSVRRAYEDRRMQATTILAAAGVIEAAEAARILVSGRRRPLRVKGTEIWIGKVRSEVLTMIFDAVPLDLTLAARAAGASIVYQLEKGE